MREQYTAGSKRILLQASRGAQNRGSKMIEPRDLLAAFAHKSESKAGELLFSPQTRLLPETLLKILGDNARPDDGRLNFDADESATDGELFEASLLPFSLDLRTILNDARSTARQWDRNTAVGSEHLLMGFLSSPSPLLESLDLDLHALKQAVNQAILDDIGPIPVDEEAPPALGLIEPGEDIELARIFDASANRVREGLRVVEDYARFALDDPMLTKRLKTVRHRLATALQSFPLEDLLGSRDTTGDVGTRLTTAQEQFREHPRAVLTANFKRITEALRSLEEFAKLRDVWLAGQFEITRYDVYTIEKMMHTAVTSRKTFGNCKLYVLVGGQNTIGDLTWLVGEILQGGADVIQIREKNLDDRDILRRAREVRLSVSKVPTARFLVNDRPDLARLAGADGVHLGQTDLTPRDARKIIGPRLHIGVSTHHPDQVRQAVLDSAGYFAVGPVFSSSTKSFEPSQLAGLELVRHAAESTSLPWFAIGGIGEHNLAQVLEAGATRIAVSAAVVKAPSPRKAAQALRDQLDSWQASQKTLA